MKEKKNGGAKKVLLMAISCALVAAISVGLTLAYLTAKTNEKDNLFKASGTVDGEVIEPNYEIEKAKAFKPGQKIGKNPMIDNDTTDYDVWVGASVEFQLSADGTNYKTVPYSVFKQYVDLEKYVGDDTTWPSNTIDDAGQKWEKMTVVIDATVVTAGSDATKKDYFFYNTMLLKQPAGDGETAASETENGTNGTTGNSTKDNTSELFASVTPKVGIDISPKYKSNLSAEDISQGYFMPQYNDNGTMTNKTLVTTTADIPVSDIDLSKLAFNHFDFKIKIVGYGVKDDVNDIATSDKTVTGESPNQVTTLSGDSKTALTGEILTQLGGKAPANS